MRNLFSLSNGTLNVNGIDLLCEVPENVYLSSFSSICQASKAPDYLLEKVVSQQHKGGFLGFTKENSSDRLMNSLGKFSNRSFLSIFRFKAWWSTMWVGSCGSDLQMETQWVLLDVPELSSYALIIPLIDGRFRSALQAGEDDHIVICAESGSTRVQACSFDAIAYVHVGSNPYDVMKESYAAARVHLNTFRLLEEKSFPPLIDKLGWCTWDAFYQSVNPIGVFYGVKDFYDVEIPLRFLIIDDGWQGINFDGDDPTEEVDYPLSGGQKMSTARLCKLEECDKFKKYEGGTLLGKNAPSFDPKRQELIVLKALELEQAQKALDRTMQSGVKDLSSFQSKRDALVMELSQVIDSIDDKASNISNLNCQSKKTKEIGMKAFIKDLQTKFTGLDDVYVWQALCGTWGGVRPAATQYEAKVVAAKVSTGLERSMRDLAWVNCIDGGIGLVHPDQAANFYHSMHSHLAEAGITGVKVDAIHTLELVCEEYGGRVDLAKAYYKGLTESLVKNFGGTGLICSMQQCNDFFFLGTWQISIGRVGDDFWYQDPNGDPMGIYWLQGLHMVHCAYNSMWMGQMIHPDWDMFKSDHQCAKFHAGSRAICGGPIYLSDTVGRHDYVLIKQLVFPDGTIPRCRHFALPTRDCLFKNPLFDEETILKIWNINKFSGVVGAFNCQGAGWDPSEQRNRSYPHCYKPVSGLIHVRDIEWDQKEEAKEMGDAEEYAVYLNQAEELLLMTSQSKATKITIQPSSFEIFSFAPVKKIGLGVRVAPIGLVNMFNSGGTLLELDYNIDINKPSLRIKVKGGGELFIYSSEKPKRSTLNGVDKRVTWTDDGKLIMELPWERSKCGISDVVFTY